MPMAFLTRAPQPPLLRPRHPLAAHWLARIAENRRICFLEALRERLLGRAQYCVPSPEQARPSSGGTLQIKADSQVLERTRVDGIWGNYQAQGQALSRVRQPDDD